jgi:hypothetical protein
MFPTLLAIAARSNGVMNLALAAFSASMHLKYLHAMCSALHAAQRHAVRSMTYASQGMCDSLIKKRLKSIINPSTLLKSFW